MSINNGDNLFEEPFLPRVEIQETQIRGRDNPYFHGVQRTPLSFKLRLLFEDQFDSTKLRQVARWLFQSSYKEFYFEGSDRRFFCIFIGDLLLLHNGAQRGYVDVEVRCDSPYSYSPEYVSQVYDFSTNPFQYIETTAPDFSQGTLSNLTVDPAGSIKLPKEGADLNNTKNTDSAWNIGTHNNTRAYNNGLELSYAVPPGTNFSKTETTKADWEDPQATRSGVDTTTSPGDLILSREGTDKTGVVDTNADWTVSGAVLNNTEAVNGNLQLAYQIQPGTAFNRTETTQSDFENTSAQRSNLDTTSSPGDLVLAKEGSNVSGAEDTQAQWATGTHTGTTATATGTGQLELAKEGTDWSSSTDNTWDTGGTHSGTTYATDGTNPAGLLKLSISGTNFNKTDDLQADFNGGTTTNVNINSGGYLELNNLPAYTSISTFTTGWDGWTQSGATPGNTTQGAKVVKLLGMNGTSTGLRKDNVFTSFSTGITVDFRAKTSLDTASLYITISTTQGFVFTIPNTNGTWAWFRARIPAGATSSTTTYLYQNGTFISNGQWSSSNSAAYVYFYKGTSSVSNSTCYIDSVYMVASDLGAMPTSYSGTYISNTFDISTVQYANTSSVSWVTSIPSTDTDGSQTVTVEFQLGTWNGSSVTWDGTWTQATSGQSIPVITKGTNYANKRMRYRVTLSTSDPNVSPHFDSITMSVTSGYNPSGVFTSTVKTGPQGVKKAARTVIDWVIQSQPAGTSVLIETNMSFNNGSTWSGWKSPTKGGAIPDITQTTDLSSAQFQFRVTLTTNDVSVTPVVDNVSYNMYTGYKPSGTRESSVINISSVGKASSTSFSWTTNGTNPSGTTVTAEVALSTDGGTTWGSWTSVTNGGPIPGITQSTNLSNARLKYRFNLSTTDTNYTPNVDSVTYTLNTGYKTSGTYTSPVFDVSVVNKVIDSLISWSANTPTNTSVVVETRTSDDGGNTWSSWSTATNGSAIPGLGAGTLSPSGKRLQYRVTLSTTDTTVTPIYNSTTLSITPTSGERYTSGYRESDIINLSTVGKARSATLSWVANTPPGTSVYAQSSLSLDGGSTWSSWQSVSNGGQIPQITQSTDLSNARLKYRIYLTTSDVSVTPTVDSAIYAILTGYKATASRTSAPLDISTTSKVVNSNISWNANIPSGTSVLVEVRLSTNGGSTWGSWTACTNGGTIPVLPPDTLTTNARLQYRVTLSTTDTNITPTFSDCTINITATLGERYQSGTYQSEIIDISPAVKAGSVTLSWTQNTTLGTYVFVETSISTDGGSTWSDWQKVSNGGQISAIEQSTNLSNVKLKYRFRLISDSKLLTPIIQNAVLNVVSGYKPSGTRRSNVIDLSPIGTAYNCVITWDEVKPSGTDIIIETSLDGGVTWTKTINGQPIPGIYDGMDMVNKTILVRETLVTNDTTKTPELKELRITSSTGLVFENIGDLELKPEIWIKKIGDGDVAILNRDTGELFEFTDLKDNEQIYVDNEEEYIESDLPGIYRYNNFNNVFLNLEVGRNELEVRGACQIQFRYRFKTLQG